jgi:Mg2+ and Co2+ transporter CorA|tara:strand:- start:4291 stop:4563 length:273 start_codon:yes stop_codon:yes gene_type:complete
MATEIGKATKLKLSLETLITVGATVVVVTTMYLTLKSEIAVAKELPKSEVTRIEYELKDELIRNTILKTQDDINKITKTLERIEDKVYDR